jgi:hypothetical protein
MFVTSSPARRPSLTDGIFPRERFLNLPHHNPTNLHQPAPTPMLSPMPTTLQNLPDECLEATAEEAHCPSVGAVTWTLGWAVKRVTVAISNCALACEVISILSAQSSFLAVVALANPSFARPAMMA